MQQLNFTTDWIKHFSVHGMEVLMQQC